MDHPEIQEGLALARALMHGTDHFVAVLDSKGVILEVNEAVARRVGRSRSRLIGSLASDLFSPAVASKRMAAFNRVRESGKTERFEDENGGRVFDYIVYPILGPGREVEKVVSIARDITELRRSEEAFQRSEERFRRYFELGLIGMVTSSPDKGIIDVNDETCRILGYDRAELLQKSWAELTHPDDLSADAAQFDRVMRGEIESYALEKRFIRKDGQVIDTSISVRAMRRADGSVECFLGLLQDVTKRKRAEEALKASEEKYRHLIKYAPTGIYEIDFLNKRFKSVNDVMCHVLGYTEEEFLRMNPLDLLDEDGKRMLLERITKSLAGEKVEETVEYNITAKSGRKLWAVLNNTFTYEEGRPTGSLVVAHDVTERRRVEEALRESEEKFRSLVETTSDWIWETDADGVYTYTSPRVRDLLGYEPQEVLGREPFEFMPPDESARVKDQFYALVKERKGCVGLENVNIRKDGRRVVLETSCVPKLDGQGNLLGYRGIDRDITDRKRAEEALQRSYDELELRVQERTAELERRNRELQYFTFAAAHDLQEPLRKIQTFSDLLTRYSDSVSTQDRDYIKRMHETATRMRDVLQSLMKYSRLTSRVEPFDGVDLKEIVKEVVSDFELQIRDTGALLEIGDLPEIEADAGQMRQLFQNLLENALKFRREGIQPVIKIHAHWSRQNRECEIRIHDNGIGFDEIYLERIFKPFQRLHGKTEYSGVGMGLAICAKVLEHHKGRITAKSTPGQGSTFFVTLPLKQARTIS